MNTQLMWYRESEGHLSDAQSGLRKKRTTVDHLVRFETFVREARKKHVSAFLYMEKAYNTTWKHGILQDLHELGFQSGLLCLISNSSLIVCFK